MENAISQLTAVRRALGTLELYTAQSGCAAGFDAAA